MIYCVEDDSGIRELIVYTLTSSGFCAKGFSEATSFWNALKLEMPELIILDIMLPIEDGMTILKKLKTRNETKDIPVIMATAKTTEYDKVIGLDTGADDYLAKPFGMMEMVSRVKAVLRRTNRCNSHENLITVNGIIVNKDEHKVYVNNEEVVLTVKEYDLLLLFMNNLNKVFNRDKLLNHIWGINFVAETRTVDVHIATLRTKLGKSGESIITVRGVGYRMEDLNDK